MDVTDNANEDQFFERILDDAIRYGGDEGPRPRKSQPDSDALTAQLIEHALDVVVAGSIFNLAPDKGRRLLTWTLASRNASQQADSIVSSDADTGGSDTVFRAFEIRRSLARSLTEVVHRECDLAQDRFTHAWDVCADSWRKSAMALVRCLAVVKQNCSDTQLCEFAILLENQLLAVQAGFSPCINDNLQVEIPGFAEQRQSIRTAVEFKATLIARGDTFDVHVKDASKAGFGVTQAPELMPGERVSLALPRGEFFTGCVRWWSAGRAGLEIDQDTGIAFDVTHYMTSGQ